MTIPFVIDNLENKLADRDEQQNEWQAGREMAQVGILEIRYLERLASSIDAFR